MRKSVLMNGNFKRCCCYTGNIFLNRLPYWENWWCGPPMGTCIVVFCLNFTLPFWRTGATDALKTLRLHQEVFILLGYVLFQLSNCFLCLGFHLGGWTLWFPSLLTPTTSCWTCPPSSVSKVVSTNPILWLTSISGNLSLLLGCESHTAVSSFLTLLTFTSPLAAGWSTMQGWAEGCPATDGRDFSTSGAWFSLVTVFPFCSPSSVLAGRHNIHGQGGGQAATARGGKSGSLGWFLSLAGLNQLNGALLVQSKNGYLCLTLRTTIRATARWSHLGFGQKRLRLYKVLKYPK